MKYENISFEELKRYYDDLSDNYSILQEKFGDEMKRNDELYLKLLLSVNQYNAVVEQNRQLQTVLNDKQKELDNLREKPFFPYELNSGYRMDFGKFILISHAWFSFLNTPDQIGIIEVEYKNNRRRVMYIGITKAVPTDNDFKASVLNVAKFGQKIKDSAEV